MRDPKIWRAALVDAEKLITELQTFHANNAGDRAIAILRRIVIARKEAPDV